MSSLRFRPNASVPTETKSGFFIYDGSAAEFHHWQFRTQIKVRSTKPDDMPRTISSIIEGLRGDALQVAIDLEADTLLNTDGSGVTKLIEDIRDYVFPQREDEAKALYREGHKVGPNSLSRQPSESMTSYIA